MYIQDNSRINMNQFDKCEEPKWTSDKKYTHNYEGTKRNKSTYSNKKFYKITKKHVQNILSSNKRQNDSPRIDRMREVGISPGRRTGTEFQRSTTSDKSRKQHMAKELLPSHVLDSVNKVKNELYTIFKIDYNQANKEVRDTIEKLFEKLKVELTNAWSELITHYSNKLFQTEEELERFKKELEEISQKNNAMKSYLFSYKEKYEELENQKLMSEENMKSIINKYKKESTRTQSVDKKAKECKDSIKDLCNQISDTHKALNVYYQQLEQTKIDEQCIQNFKREETKLIELINRAKRKFDNGITAPLKLKLPHSHIPTYDGVRTLENRIKYYNEYCKEAKKKIRSLEESHKNLENKYKELSNKSRQDNYRNMRAVTPQLKKKSQAAMPKQNVYKAHFNYFSFEGNQEAIIKDTTAGNRKLYQSPSKALKIRSKSVSQTERRRTQESRIEIRDLKEKQSQGIRRIGSHYPKQDDPTRNKIDQAIWKPNNLSPKTYKPTAIIKEEDNKKAREVRKGREVISYLYEECLTRICNTNVRLNGKIKALKQKVNTMNEVISNQRNKPKSNNLENVINSLKKILNIAPYGNNIEKSINKVKEAIKKLIAEKESLETKYNNLLNEKTALEEEIKQLNLIILKNEDLIKKNSSKIKKKDIKYGKLLTEFNNLKRKLEAQDTNKNLREKQKVEEEALTESLKKLNKDLEGKNNLMNEYEETKNSFQDEIAKLRRENINLKNELGNSKTQIKQLNDLVNEYKLENTKLKGYEDENKKLKEELDRLIKIKDDNLLETTNIELKEEINELKRKYEDLKRIKDKEKKELVC